MALAVLELKRSTCLCLLSAGTKAVCCHHCPMDLVFLTLTQLVLGKVSSEANRYGDNFKNQEASTGRPSSTVLAKVLPWGDGVTCEDRVQSSSWRDSRGFLSRQQPAQATDSAPQYNIE